MTDSSAPVAQYGVWAADIVEPPEGAVQVSPLHPGSRALEDEPEGSVGSVAMRAPAGTLERRGALAAALRALAPGGALTVLAPKAKGGSRLAAELEAFGCRVTDTARRHHRICTTTRPEAPAGLADALADAAPRFSDALGLWTQPGLFSWDRVDPGSALLIRTMPLLKGRGADLGCGLGVLAHRVLAGPAVTGLTLIDIDRRALACARRNVDDPRVGFAWADARASGLTGLDFVVSNPPFHGPDGGEDQGVGQAFLRAAAAALRKGGTAWIVANRHLAYEAVLREAFTQVTTSAEAEGYKVFEARK